ncbi:hypothetical protein F4819DRAFT_481874 [Hypoxylon fuscum]|nr:hypothetical protein F4819DRAFT_481874 [Hypoxylon fuscum]
MNTPTLATALFGVAWQIPSTLIIAESTRPDVMLNNSTLNFVESSTTIIADRVFGTATQGTTTQVVVNVIRTSDVIVNKSSTTQPLVDSVPPRITIDTILASVAFPEITQERQRETPGVQVMTGRPGASQISATTGSGSMQAGHR